MDWIVWMLLVVLALLCASKEKSKRRRMERQVERAELYANMAVKAYSDHAKDMIALQAENARLETLIRNRGTANADPEPIPTQEEDDAGNAFDAFLDHFAINPSYVKSDATKAALENSIRKIETE